jgi:hypothetical protein
MATIIAKHLGPTSRYGSRIRVRAEGHPARTYAWDYALTPEQNYVDAVSRYARERGIRPGDYVAGEVRPGLYAFVPAGSRAYRIGAAPGAP